MSSFLSTVAVAATSGYALVAYAICGALFLFSGAKLLTVKHVLRRIEHVPESERRRLIEALTNSVLPESITADQWIRNNRNRWVYLLCAAVVLVVAAVATVAIIGPDAEPKGPPPTIEEARQAASDFLAKMDARQYEEAYEGFYPAWQAQLTEAQWLQLCQEVRKPVGDVEDRRFMGAQTGKFTMDQPLHGIQLLFHTKFTNLPRAVSESVGLASPGKPENWKAVSYYVDAPPGGG